MTEELIHLPIEETRAAKWRRGRGHYGPVFIGHMLEELDEGLLDAMNYAEEAARRGFPMAGIAEDLRGLCERTRAIYCAVEGIPEGDGPRAGWVGTNLPADCGRTEWTGLHYPAWD